MSWLTSLSAPWPTSSVSRGKCCWCYLIPHSSLYFLRFLNTSTPFDLGEHDAVWKDPLYVPWGFEEYKDFKVRRAAYIMLNCTEVFMRDPRSTTQTTSLVNCLSFGLKTVSSRTLVGRLAVGPPTLTSMATWKRSVSTLIGSVNWQNSRQCRIGCASGNRM